MIKIFSNNLLNLSKNFVNNSTKSLLLNNNGKRYMGIMQKKYGMVLSPSAHQLNEIKIAEAIKAKEKKEIKDKLPYKRVVRSFNITPPNYEELSKPLAEPAPIKDSKRLNVAVIGAPNAGKSTLVNSIVGDHVCAVSPIEHTTRDTVLGVMTKDNVQIIFHDTPGVIKNSHFSVKLKEFVNMAWGVVRESDLVMMVVDATNHNEPDTNFIIEKLSNEMMELLREYKSYSESTDKQFILVLNKVDLVSKKSNLISLISKLNEGNIFADTFVVSATNNIKVDQLVNYLVSKSKPGVWQFEKTVKTDQTDIFRASEIIREKLYSTLRKEVPYAIGQNTIGWTRFNDGSLRIDHEFIVTKKSHKAFILGVGGSNIKSIYLTSKQTLEKIFNHKVHLFLSIKTKKELDLSTVSAE